MMGRLGYHLCKNLLVEKFYNIHTHSLFPKRIYKKLARVAASVREGSELKWKLSPVNLHILWCLVHFIPYVCAYRMNDRLMNEWITHLPWSRLLQPSDKPHSTGWNSGLPTAHRSLLQELDMPQIVWLTPEKNQGWLLGSHGLAHVSIASEGLLHLDEWSTAQE